MRYKLIIRPEAEQDIRQAHSWYEQQNKGLGLSFVASLDAAFSNIQRSPLIYAKIHKYIRRALIRRFPYGIFYFVKPSEIIILAVFHAKRNPAHWQRRYNNRLSNQ